MKNYENLKIWDTSMRFLSVFIVLTLLFRPVISLSEDTVKRALVEYEGVTGYFFAEEVGDHILEDLEKYRIQKELIRDLGRKLALQDTKILGLEDLDDRNESILEKKDDIINLQDKSINTLQKDNYILRNSKDKWYNSRALWFCIGTVAGGFLAVGLSFGLQKANEVK